jgi:phage repressor protein C with HTH and peptisase S24 domain
MEKNLTIKIFSELLLALKMNVSELARDLGMNRPQALYDILNPNKKVGISKNMADKICLAFPNVNKTYLLTGEGISILNNSDLYKDEQNKELNAVPAHAGIPLIPLDAFAGFGTDNSSQILEYECERYVVPDFKGAEFLIRVKGSSMYPKYASGDIVGCKKIPLDTFFQWNKVYVLDTEQGVLIKRIKPGKDDDHILLVSENEKYEPFMLHRSSITSLAIVIGVIRLE